MTDLDDLKGLEKYDRTKMLDLITAFPEQIRDAKCIGSGYEAQPELKRSYKNMVIAGVGGSAIGADLVRSYVLKESKNPIIVNRNYTRPGCVGDESLVVASSYSGNTEETLSAYDDAKAKSAKIIAITSGGELEKKARSDGFGVMIVPKGMPPRAALGYSFFPLLILLSKLGLLIGQKDKEIDETIQNLRELNDKKIGQAVPSGKNIAKRIAAELYGKFPIIYGGQDNIDSIVTRWRGQLAENAKTLSSSQLFPEMNHNEIVGWENPKSMLKSLAVVMLRDKDDHPRNSKRMDITKTIIEKEGVKVIEVSSIGGGLLSRIFSLIYMGDFVSFYLAMLNKRDPTPVERVTYLKNKLIE